MKSKPVIYLDNAASSFPKPGEVAKEVYETIDRVGGSPGRGGHQMALTAGRIMLEGRLAIARLLELSHPERIVFTKNATEGINLALRSLLKKGDSVACSAIEHNAVIRPLAAMKQDGIKIVEAPVNVYGLPDPKNLPGVTALVTTAASNVTGSIADLETIGKACAKKGILFIVDAAQAAGSIPLDLKHVDAIICSGHKGLLGPQGIGFVWFSPTVDPSPMIFGGTGSESVSQKMPDYWPDRFEAGTPNTPGVAGLTASIQWLTKKGVSAVRKKELGLIEMISKRFSSNQAIITYPPFDPAMRASLVCFNVDGRDPSDVADLLDQNGIAVRAGLHCAPEGHKTMGTFPAGAIRVSPGPFTTKKEIKTFFAALDKIIGKR